MGHFDSNRGGLYPIAYPKTESPCGGFGPKGKASKSLAEARTPYLPTRSLPWDLVGVERWVSCLAGDLGPGVP